MTNPNDCQNCGAVGAVHATGVGHSANSHRTKMGGTCSECGAYHYQINGGRWIRTDDPVE